MDLDDSLLTRIQKRIQGSRMENMAGTSMDESSLSINHEKKSSPGFDEDKDIDTTECEKEKCVRSSRPQFDDIDLDVQVIPDTPSPVFSKFSNKNHFKDPSLLRAKPRTDLNGKFFSSKDSDRMKQQPLQKSSKDKEGEKKKNNGLELNFMKSELNVNKDSLCDTDYMKLPLAKEANSPSKKFFDRISMQNKSHLVNQDTKSEEMQRTRDRAVDKITSLREKKKETAKRFLDDLYEDCITSSTCKKSNEEKDKACKDSKDTFIRLKYAREKKKRKKDDKLGSTEMKDGNESLNLPPPMHIDHDINNEMKDHDFTQNILGENLKSTKVKKKCTTVCQPEVSKKELSTDLSSLTDIKQDGTTEPISRGSCFKSNPVKQISSSLSEEDGLKEELKSFSLIAREECEATNTSEGFRSFSSLTGGGWPSESDSDSSDIDDSVPLREILNTNQTKTGTKSNILSKGKGIGKNTNFCEDRVQAASEEEKNDGKMFPLSRKLSRKELKEFFKRRTEDKSTDSHARNSFLTERTEFIFEPQSKSTDQSLNLKKSNVKESFLPSGETAHESHKRKTKEVYFDEKPSKSSISGARLRPKKWSSAERNETIVNNESMSSISGRKHTNASTVNSKDSLDSTSVLKKNKKSGKDLSPKLAGQNHCNLNSSIDIDDMNRTSQAASVISVSSDDSLNVSHLEMLMSEDYAPSCQEYSQSNTLFVHPSLTRISPVAKSLRRGRHINKQVGERNNLSSVDLTSESETDFAGASAIQSPLVSSSGMSARTDNSRNAVPISSTTIRVPGLKRTRTNSTKGHVNRNNTSSLHHGSFSPASSLVSPLLHRRDGDVSPRHHRDVVRAVQQAVDDEEYARRLQEEMDLEFALTLQNMENEPPQEFTEPGNVTPPPAPSFMERILIPSHSRNRRSGTFIPGMEDILMSSDSEDSLTFEHSFPTSTSPNHRPRTRSSRAARAAQRLHSHHTFLNGVDDLMSFLGSMEESQGGRRRGHRGSRVRFGTVSFGMPEGNDYEDLLNLAEVLGEVKKRGLSATQAARLPERRFEATTNPDDNTECMICMCEYQVNDKLRILPCFHEFHSPCIDKWIQNNATCPICRVEVKI